MIKYCRESTLSHPLVSKYPKCAVDLLHKMREDGYCGKAVNTPCQVIAIDCDLLERFIAMQERRSQSSTVDLIIGVKKSDKIFNTITVKNYVLVELKLNVINPNKLSSYEINSKVKNSSKMVINDNCCIRNEIVILFQKDKVQQSRAILSRLMAKPFKNFVITCPEEFFQTYFN